MKITIWKPSPAQIAGASTDGSACVVERRNGCCGRPTLDSSVVDDADRHRLVEPAPDPGHGRRGRQERQEIERADEAVHEAHAVEMVGDDEGEQEADRRADEQVERRCCGRPARTAGRRRAAGSCRAPTKAGRRQQVPVGEGEPEGLAASARSGSRRRRRSGRRGTSRPRPPASGAASGGPRRGPGGPRPTASMLARPSTGPLTSAGCSSGRGRLLGLGGLGERRLRDPASASSTRLAMSMVIWRCAVSSTNSVVCEYSSAFRNGP